MHALDIIQGETQMAAWVAPDQIGARWDVKPTDASAPGKKAKIDSKRHFGDRRLPGGIGRLRGVHKPVAILGQLWESEGDKEAG
jgi:hypothetical protein